MYLNQKLSIVRHAVSDIKSAEMAILVASLPADSEARRAIEQLKTIKNVGDVGAIEILLSVLSLIERDDCQTRRQNGR